MRQNVKGVRDAEGKWGRERNTHIDARTLTESCIYEKEVRDKIAGTAIRGGRKRLGHEEPSIPPKGGGASPHSSAGRLKPSLSFNLKAHMACSGTQLVIWGRYAQNAH